MRILGVENSPEDFSQGIDMFSNDKRQFTVFSDWSNLVYRDADCKIVLPMKVSASFESLNEITTADDKPFADNSAVFNEKLNNLVRVLQDSGKFTKAYSQAR